MHGAIIRNHSLKGIADGSTHASRMRRSTIDASCDLGRMNDATVGNTLCAVAARLRRGCGLTSYTNEAENFITASVELASAP